MGLSDSLGDRFDVHEHGSSVRTELLAGVTTFLTMSYIVVVNPAILSGAIAPQGVPQGEVRSMLAVVTIIAAATATLVMALYANRPFAQAPGLGLNAFFAFTVVGALGVPWQTALAAVVVEGVLFVALTAVGAREYVIGLFPKPVKFAVGTGIGLFLAIIGLQAMGIVVGDDATLVTLGSVASNPVAILSVLGLFLTFALYARDVPGSIIVGIALTTAAGCECHLFGGRVGTGDVGEHLPEVVRPVRSVIVALAVLVLGVVVVHTDSRWRPSVENPALVAIAARWCEIGAPPP
jgi:AGZA family xanthine/uracil permease-like MFS transporter